MIKIKLLDIVLKFGTKHFVDKDFSNETVAEMVLHKIHPKQIVLRIENNPFMFYKVEYEYTTIRGNKKQGIKYFVFNTYSPEKNMKKELEKHIDEFNKKNIERQLLNVKFLKSKCLGYAEIPV